jgi:Mn-dependent DtxR family transcriptional regulator
MAVLQYVKALRALGHTRINSVMIADALNLDHQTVLKAVKDLQTKGIKVI